MTGIPPRLAEALAGSYRLKRQLGHGGMATVYLADDLRRGGEVAIKVLRPELTPALGAGRFQREIEIATRLTHPNIVALLGSNQIGEFLYHTMRYVPGESLQALLDRLGPLPVPRVLAIAGDVAAALDYAHAQNVVHRDIKPTNILFDGDRALVCDFGLARAIERSALEPISSSGLVLGTPAYMSPEQATARGEIDARTDVYAMGCVVYQMLTGEVPFSGPTPQAIMARQIGERPRPIRTVRPEVSVGMELAVLTALAKEPETRPGSGGELVRRLSLAGT